jgi:ferritin-like metal-binding protein YciE
MAIVTLRDLYVAELQDLLDAEQQILQELPSLARASTSAALRQAFDDHLEDTRVHAERLELLLRKLDAPSTSLRAGPSASLRAGPSTSLRAGPSASLRAGAQRGAPCEAIRGLIAEGRRRIADCERGDVLDAALIGAAQRIEHYEIAGYGCARTYARILGDPDAQTLLQQTLEEEGKADARLTRIAERGINQAAGEDVSADTERQRTRLRYVPVSQLHDFKYRAFQVRNTQDEDLGMLDGLIVDSRSHRPEYFVVDAGGWLGGHRYLIPIYELKPDEATKSLRTDLDRKSIEARPPFNADAYCGPAGDTESGEFRPPTWLMTGVWMTEATGFASVPPRAQCDYVTPLPSEPPVREEYPENELMMARGEPEDRGDAARSESGVQPRDTEDPKSTEPRIERYRER